MFYHTCGNLSQFIRRDKIPARQQTMKEGNTQLTLHNESVDKLTGWLTMFVQVSRAMRMHKQAEKMETVRNTIQAQFHPVE